MNKIKNVKILVTGAAGFIGSHLVDKLLIEGYNVVGLDNLRNGKLENLKQAQSNVNFSFIKGDILNEKDVNVAMENINIVYHLACLGVRHSIHSPFENHRVNAEGTIVVLDAARQGNVKKFFYISTSEVYGKALNFPIKETDATYPLSVYGSSKLVGEHYTNSYQECYGLDTTVLRIFNNYGPRAHYEGDCGEVIPRSIVRILYGLNPVVFGDGEATRDFLYVKDTATVLASFVNCVPIERTLNIGLGTEYTIKELLEKIIAMMPEYDATLEFAEVRPADVPRLWVDNSKFASMRILDDFINFDQGLKVTIDYYKDLSSVKNLMEEVVEKNWLSV